MIKVGVIGYGYWGPNLVRNFMAAPDSAVTRVCDLREERIAPLRKIYPGIKTCSNSTDLINDPQIDAVVIGVSPDSLESHRKFKQKYELPYKLLSDDGHQLADAFDIWKEKSMYGLKFMGVERTTVIIDRGGRIARIFPRVKIPGHVQEVEKAVRELA